MLNAMSGTADDIPGVIGGTEFIALQLRNMNTGSVFLRNIQINNELHDWDEGTAGINFKAASSLDAGTKYPRAGFFSIIPSPERPNPKIQFTSQEVQGNEEVRVIIKDPRAVMIEILYSHLVGSPLSSQLNPPRSASMLISVLF